MNYIVASHYTELYALAMIRRQEIRSRRRTEMTRLNTQQTTNGDDKTKYAAEDERRLIRRQEIRSRRRTEMTRLMLLGYYVGCCQQRNNLGLINLKLHF